MKVLASVFKGVTPAHPTINVPTLVVPALVVLAIMSSACGGGGSPGVEPATAEVSLPAGTLQFSAPTYSVGESQAAAVTISRINGSAGAVTATVTTTNGTAIAGQDYTATSTTVTFAAGDTTAKVVNIPITNDVLTEVDETFNVTLTSAQAGQVTNAVVTIQDDDPPGALQISRATYTIGEGGGAVEIGIDRVNGSAGAVTVVIATQNGSAVAGQDYTAVTSTVSFAAGDVAQKFVSVPILSDGLQEADESFTVTLSSPTGGASLGALTTATITIPANDAPPPPPAGGQPGSLQLSVATLDVNEAASNAVITISRVGGSVGTVTARLVTANASALAGQDYTAVNTVVTFANGDTTDKFVNIPILNDTIAEPLESFSVTLSVPTGGATLGTPTTMVISIEDNDAPASPVLALATDIRMIHLSWPAVATTTAYKLYFNADGASGFTQLGADLSPATTSFDIDVTTYKFNWNGALYRLEACNDVGCTGSASTGTLNRMLQAIGYFKSSAGDSNDNFGKSVAMSADGNTLAVGAPNEDSNATGVDGNSANNGASDSGAVYVFARTGGVWARQAYLKGLNSAAGNKFGTALSMSSDGNTLAIGAPGRATNTGATYLFVRSGTTWSQQTFVVPTNAQSGDLFGSSVGLASNGNTLVVGAPGEASNATTINGSETDNSAPGAGAAYAYTRTGTAWTKQTFLKATNSASNDAFGAAVTISGDGNTIAIGASAEDSDAITINGNQGSNAALDSGAVYVFARSGATWLPPDYLKSANSEAGDLFGIALSLSSDGNTLAIGASKEDGQAVGVNGSRQADSNGCVTNDPLNIAKCNSGAVYIFSHTAGAWSQDTYLKSSNSNALDEFGAALSLSADGNSLIAGAINDDSSSTGVDGDQYLTNAKQSGAAYLFTRTAGVWSQRNYFKAPNPNTDDVFGTAVAINANGDSLAVGAIGEDSNAINVSGDRADNSLTDAGAVYLY